MPHAPDYHSAANSVSVPFNAGRGLMQPAPELNATEAVGFSTLQCGSWIDAMWIENGASLHSAVSVPFNAGRGLMPLSTLQGHQFVEEFQYPSMRVVD